MLFCQRNRKKGPRNDNLCRAKVVVLQVSAKDGWWRHSLGFAAPGVLAAGGSMGSSVGDGLAGSCLRGHGLDRALVGGRVGGYLKLVYVRVGSVAQKSLSNAGSDRNH